MARVFVSTNTDTISYGHIGGLDGASQVAVSFWVRPITGGGAWGVMLAQNGASTTGSGTNTGILIQFQGGDMTAVFVTARNAGSEGSRVGYGLTVDTWHQVVVQYDGTQGTATDRLRIYIDGSAAGSQADFNSTPATLGTTDQPLVLGARSDGADYFDGRLAGVWVWAGVVLSGGEITSLAGGDLGSAVRPTGLILGDGLWQGTTPTNAVTSTAATVSGTTEAADPPLLDPPPSSGNRRRRVLLCGSN